eukprot:gnl/TRDRNA2_/TRDRNA2_123933_c3_seq1.p1 gnl/TRDRNA2_/TRDRNA2_123933_c3~~gnl/TRDRNA2_/TRDRNA2_123933_c3_seq1.p1  ORF type:complete len:331 (-),score=32.32 gnl/TRDRNA2_/TRDRNA2_123933_c3_seq1:41-919(-)
MPRGATFADLERRFLSTVDLRPKWSHPDQLSLRCVRFDPPWIHRWNPWIYNHEVLMETGAVSLLRRCARRYGVPIDVVLFSLVLAAMFRATATKSERWFDAKKATSSDDGPATHFSLPLTLYSPMRDGDLNEAMVGLFSDWRDVTVSCGGHTTVLGLCLEVAEVIRSRRWTVFDPVQNSERILVNMLPLDEEARGAKYFRQTRLHEYGNRRKQPGRERRTCYRGAGRPMRLTLEQEAPDAWWLSLDTNADYYPPSWMRRFVHELRRTALELDEYPLVPLLPVEAAPGGRRSK